MENELGRSPAMSNTITPETRFEDFNFNNVSLQQANKRKGDEEIKANLQIEFCRTQSNDIWWIGTFSSDVVQVFTHVIRAENLENSRIATFGT